MSKKTSHFSGLVYSTDPDFKPSSPEESEEELLPEKDQQLRVKLETKHRAGKAVTLIENFKGPLAIKEELGKKLKSYCGTGGSVKDGEILVQGDHRDKIVAWLQKNGYSKSKRV